MQPEEQIPNPRRDVEPPHQAADGRYLPPVSNAMLSHDLSNYFERVAAYLFMNPAKLASMQSALYKEKASQYSLIDAFGDSPAELE
jgi:hypothetical protein